MTIRRIVGIPRAMTKHKAKINLKALNPSELETVRKSIEAVATGAFFPEWEFQTLFGLERSYLLDIIEDWPPAEVTDLVEIAIVNTLNNLSGYPHGKDEQLDEIIPESQKSILAILKRLCRVPCPPEIDGAKVIYFATTDERPPHDTEERLVLHATGDKPVKGLAICKYESVEGYYLFGCDENWNSLTDTWDDSVESAKEQAEFNYNGATIFWHD